MGQRSDTRVGDSDGVCTSGPGDRGEASGLMASLSFLATKPLLSAADVCVAGREGHSTC